MRDFLDRSACNGYSPRCLSHGSSIFRSALTSKLLRERHVPRYIVAPAGYGKSMLALQYADMVFSFQNVYWIDCQSPCFLRDLDAGIIAERLCEGKDDPLLVVFDDVPMLDSARSRDFMNQVDSILGEGGEVLVTCTPSCDSFSSQRDRMKIGPWDMLLTDDELQELRVVPEIASHDGLPDAPWQRIPKLVWGEKAERGSFLIDLLREELPDDMRASVFVMMVLGSGDLSDIGAFACVKPESLNLLERDYPHLGINQELGAFRCMGVSLDDSEIFPSKVVSSIAEGSCFSSKEGLSVALADTLLSRGMSERACSLMERMPSLTTRMSWLVQRADQLLDEGCLVPASRLFARCSLNERNLTSALCSGEMLRQLLLSENSEALSLASRILKKVDASVGERSLAALVFFLLYEDPLPEEVVSIMEAAAGSDSAELPTGSEVLNVGGGVGGIRFLNILAAARSDTKRAFAMQCRWLDEEASSMAMISSSFLLRDVRRQCSLSDCDADLLKDISHDAFELGCRVASLHQGSERDSVTLPVALVVSEYARLSQCGLSVESCFGGRVIEASSKAEMDLLRQQKAWHMLCAAQRSGSKADMMRGKRLALENQSVVVEPTRPLLRVNLFGGMDVFIGSQRLDPSLFSRRKVRTLLALLVLNGGKEYSCDRLIQLMWPGKPLRAGRNNLYVVWGELRRALELPDRSCPYLIRQQQGLRINSDLLVSDVQSFNAMCRTLSVESPSYGGWMHIHDQLSTDFLEDLLPSEDKNDYISGMRTSYRNRLVDSLVDASERLADAGDERKALWFAQAAVMRGRTREDAHYALMYAQLAANQRTAALETYFECARILSEELGIDPSARMMRLYKIALESEDDWGR